MFRLIPNAYICKTFGKQENKITATKKGLRTQPKTNFILNFLETFQSRKTSTDMEIFISGKRVASDSRTEKPIDEDFPGAQICACLKFDRVTQRLKYTHE
jgi:hypothetical protein